MEPAPLRPKKGARPRALRRRIREVIGTIAARMAPGPDKRSVASGRTARVRFEGLC